MVQVVRNINVYISVRNSNRNNIYRIGGIISVVHNKQIDVVVELGIKIQYSISGE